MPDLYIVYNTETRSIVASGTRDEMYIVAEKLNKDNQTDANRVRKYIAA